MKCMPVSVCWQFASIFILLAAEKVKGIQMSIRGKEPPDQNFLSCMNLNFTSAGIQFKAVEMVGACIHDREF